MGKVSDGLGDSEGSTRAAGWVRIAAAAKIPVVPRGAGSGLSGGSSAVEGGIIVCLDRMREIASLYIAGRQRTNQSPTSEMAPT